ncbi:bifunctional enoyl-CoA hydratase/phosphate acetyltransferase [Lutispora thermophila]|uniref:Phosphate butyryltransferase n=1 Tax=Lutispora thermophila DSM 19022 TaxID=1122184 RepID=A0A1M6GQ40_9FIRM|nr:bifunctional enoyl-CoA hydratase/phosphate acetyltransferase [Lutispora thermophila]SHJ12084.1 phosphate butyryltransferase [Lutispora thermophila DSM 19022]
MIRDFDEMLSIVKSNKTMRIAVAAAQDKDVLEAVTSAAKMKLAEPILVGDEEAIRSFLRDMDIPYDFRIVNEPDVINAAKTAVSLVKEGEADFLMKGLIQTADIMRAVLDKDNGLRTDSLISHVMVYKTDSYDKLLFLTDGGINVAPNLEQKIKILENAITVCKAMGLDKIYVSVLAGAESVNPKIPATVDADALANMKDRWSQLNTVVEGPVALDLAISKQACHHKGYKGEGGGNADVLLVPYYEVGNALGKSLTYFANAKSAGIIMGAKVPIVLVSRADTSETKLLSIALGSIVANYK